LPAREAHGICPGLWLAGIAGLLILFMLVAACDRTDPALQQASSSYQSRRDYASLEILASGLHQGMARTAVERLLGEADYSPVDGQYYYAANPPATRNSPVQQQQYGSPGLILDYRNPEGELTGQLQHFELGLIGE